MRVLIVEDEPVIGMELEDVVTAAGHEVVGYAAGHASAMAFAEARSPELAFVDLNLFDGDTGLKISRQLAERGVVVVITSATSFDVGNLDQALRIVPKPYTAETIQTVLRYAAEKRDSRGEVPKSLAGLLKKPSE